MSPNTQRVRDFVAAWSRNDLDEIMGYFAPDAVYHNIPVDAVKGTDAIRKAIAAYSTTATEAEWVLHQIAENAHGVVLTERTDRFKIGGKWIELPVMGTFELRDGLLTAWRDYFDMQQLVKQLPGAGQVEAGGAVSRTGRRPQRSADFVGIAGPRFRITRLQIRACPTGREPPDDRRTPPRRHGTP
jgi:limonene-1,2-epoxide hydrolase